MIGLFLLGVLAFLAYRYLSGKHTYLKRQFNLDGPKPWPLLGNIPQIWSSDCEMLQIHYWTEKFGRTFGYYEGNRPIICTSDISIVQDILFKKWANFHSHKESPLQKNPDEDDRVNIFEARGLRWKRLRMISSPTFTNANLREICPIVRESANEFLRLIEKKHSENGFIDIYPYYQMFTMDAIAKMALGETKNQMDDPNNIYLKLCNQVFSDSRPKALYVPMLLINIFPELKPIIADIFTQSMKLFAKSVPFVEIHKRVEAEIEKRRAQAKAPERTDFIQLFMDAEAQSLSDEDKQLMGLAGQGSKQLKLNDIDVEKKLTAHEIVSQCVIFLLAGFDTTSNTLAYTTHLLANHPDVQAKLIAEIDAAKFGDLDEITNDDVFPLEYMECVMKETLRLYPLAMIGNTRRCMLTCEVGDSKLLIPEGQTIQIDPWTLHYDKKIWGDDAAQFRPERFSPSESAGRNPAAWIPFGGGPRICLGMRLAQLEFKILLVKILSKYRFEKCAKTATMENLKIGGTTTISPDHVYVKLAPRK